MSVTSKATASRLVLLAGDEEISRRRALEAILSEAGVEKDDFDYEVLDADASSPMHWLASVSTAPFLADRRTTVVRHLLRCDVDSLKGANLATLPEASRLILVMDDEGGSDDKVQRMKTTVRKGWEKAVKAAGGTILTFDADVKEARTGLKREVANQGKTITDQAAETLIEMTGGSLSRALDELNKLVLFVGAGEQIRENHVREIVVPSREWNVFAMVDAILAGEVPEALRQLRILTGGNAKAEDAAFRSILPMLSRAVRLLWQGRICVERGCTPGNAPPEVLGLFPDKPNLTKEHPYRQSKVMASARRVDFSKLTRAIGILCDTDARLKGQLASFSTIDTLERMVLELTDALA